MKTIQIDNITFEIPGSFDELPVKVKEKVLRLVSNETDKHRLKGQLLGLLLYKCAQTPRFIDKINLFWLVITLENRLLSVFIDRFSKILEPILTDFRAQTPPYYWVKSFDVLSFNDFREAITHKQKYYDSKNNDHLLNMCQALNHNPYLPRKFDPMLVLIYHNTMMDVMCKAFPHVFVKSEDKPEGNPWATALKNVSLSPKNMEENDNAVCLTVLQWMEDAIKHNIKLKEEYDNRSQH